MKKLTVLLASSEVAPFSKTGGLADISGSLPKVLKDDVKIIVLTPYYQNVDLSTYTPQVLKAVKIVMTGNNYFVDYYYFNDENVTYVFVKHPFYERENYYGYHDDDERFFLFSYSILTYLKRAKIKADLLHLNDWQTAITPFLLKTHYRSDPLFKDLKTLLSIHNLQFQGSFEKDSFKYTNSAFSYDYIHFERVNFLKAGITLANKINTVSPSYQKEIQTEYYGFTLDGALKSRVQDLKGILNGIDYQLYNPETDHHLFFNYTKNSFISGKKNNKLALLKELKLPALTTLPIVGHIGRLATQKGIDLMLATLEETITKTNAFYLFLGSGEKKYEEFFLYLMHKYPQKVFTHIGFENRLAHLIYASSDLFLMPSLFEPCGLAQMISMRYGTLPIVRETGGLKDTVIPYNKYTNEGTGFSFKNYNAHEMMATIISAVNLFNNNQPVFKSLQKQALNQDYSLKKMGRDYLNLYQKIIKEE
ncbi:MAG: glycogen/starch synthase [Acholeplasmataceae bacterium]|nr:glycogen/starch synthase [Acholeplasmataceae bacterium]